MGKKPNILRITIFIHVSTKFAYNMWYNNHFTATCFGSEYMPSLKPITVKRIDYIYGLRHYQYILILKPFCTRMQINMQYALYIYVFHSKFTRSLTLKSWGFVMIKNRNAELLLQTVALHVVKVKVQAFISTAVYLCTRFSSCGW